jgi:hypothetical protein
VHHEENDKSVDVTVVVNGVEWIEKTALQTIGRPVPCRVWAVQSLSGDTITDNGDSIRMMTRSVAPWVCFYCFQHFLVMMSLCRILRSYIGYTVFGDIGFFPREGRFPFVTWH